MHIRRLFWAGEKINRVWGLPLPQLLKTTYRGQCLAQKLEICCCASHIHLSFKSRYAPDFLVHRAGILYRFIWVGSVIGGLPLPYTPRFEIAISSTLVGAELQFCTGSYSEIVFDWYKNGWGQSLAGCPSHIHLDLKLQYLPH